MRDSRAQEEDAGLEVERQLRYMGAARISLDVLRFPRDQPRELDPRHVEFLTGCFRKEGCRRRPIRNHVPAIIDRQHLDAAMRDSGVSARQLMTKPHGDYAELQFEEGTRLECLHGKHRIEAGRQHLEPPDDWWIVDIYLSDLDANLKTCLVEEYSNEEKPSDGEIYRKIRQYDSERNLSFKMRWMARLRGNRLKSLNTLLKHEELTDAFDSLLDIPGLWDGMKLSTIHKIFPMRCDEEFSHYLRLIRRVWSDLVRGDKTAMRKIDTATVKALERRAPRASARDVKALRSQLREGDIFSAFTERERDDIWSRLRTIDGLIPSLLTFFRDAEYLKVCADCVTRLVTVAPGQGVSDAVRRKFTGVNQKQGHVTVQVAENTFTYRQDTRADRADLGYRQICAAAMREWPDLPREPEKQDPVKSSRVVADPAALRRLADLADQLGFKSQKITRLRLLPGSKSAEKAPPRLKPLLVTSGPGVPVAQRCGKPRTRAYEEDRDSLFIDHLQDERQDQGQGITPFFVRRSVYSAFYGRSTSRTDGDSVASEPLPDSPSPSTRRSSRRPSVDEADRWERGATDRDGESPEYGDGDINGILAIYAQREDASPHPGTNEGTDEDLESTPERAESLHDGLDQQARDQEQERLAAQQRERDREEELERQLEMRRERLRREKRERLDAERERQELERVEREKARERKKREIEEAERALAMKWERVRQEKRERRDAERERQEHEKMQREKVQELERLKQEKIQREMAQEQETLEQERLRQQMIHIDIRIWEKGSWRNLPPVMVDPADPSELELVAKSYMREKLRVFNTKLQALSPQECF